MDFKGLLKALVVSAANSDECGEEDMEFLKRQEAMKYYVACHGLYEQTQAATAVICSHCR